MSAPIPVFSERPSAVSTPKLRALVKFPGNVEATTGISVEKLNGTWTFETDWSQFGTVSETPASATNYLLTYDTLSQNYVLVPTSVFGSVDKADMAYVDSENAAQDALIAGKADTADVDAADALRVLKTGDTMTGGLIVITPGGGAFVYTTAIHVGFNNASSNGISVRAATDAGGGASAVFYNAAGAAVGTIYSSASATAYNTSSAAELKEDLKEFDAGRIVDDTNVYDFAWKSTGERSYGVIAQQAVEVYPQAVTHVEKNKKGGRDEWWGIDYSKYVPVLLQELKALRARVAQLEGGGPESPKPTAPKRKKK